MLNANNLENYQKMIVDLIQEMKALSISPEAHFKLCDILNYSKLSDHQDYANWTVDHGRFECFVKIKNLLGKSQSVKVCEKRRA